MKGQIGLEEQKGTGSRRFGRRFRRKRGRFWMNKSREIRELGGMDVRVLDHSKLVCDTNEVGNGMPSLEPC